MKQVAGFKDIHTGKIEDIMLIKTPADIEKFKEMYGILTKNIRIKMSVEGRYNYG